MECEFFVVSSITYALKAKSELENRGIPSKVEKIKNVAALKGCGYGVKVQGNLSVTAKRILNISGIKIIDTLDCEAKKR